MSGRSALGDYRWVNVRPGTGITSPRQAHYARYEGPREVSPLRALCDFVFAPEDTVRRPAEPYPRCPHCEQLAKVAAARPAEYAAAYRAGYIAARLADWKEGRRVPEAGS